jgi:hypothetical protein
MNIRAINEGDICKLRKIHQEFYKDEFEFPDFLNNYLCTFCITDEQDKIISAGGIRLITEIVALTDKNHSTRKRRTALYQILQASQYLTQRAGFDRLHIVTEQKIWKHQLEEAGFHSRGDILVLDI